MKRRIKAFTLIEMLLGLGLFSIIALSLYGAFASGMKIERRSEGGNRIYREIRWSLDKITDDLENMVSYDFSNSYPEKTAFLGEAHRLSCVVPTESGLTTVNYYLKLPEEGSVYTTVVGKRYNKNTNMVVRFEEQLSVNLLVREEKSFIESLQAESGTTPELDILSARVAEDGLTFYYAYLEGEEENAQIIWKDSWAFDYLPSGIRVELNLIPFDRTEDAVTIRRDVFIPIGFLGRESL